MKAFLLKWLPLCVACLAIFIVVLDSTLLNVALPVLVQDFHTTIQNLQWVISGYSLLLAALLITGGRFGDLYGRKKMFIIGAIIFAIGSFITSISQTFPVLLIGESIIEGLGAALMVPATAALIVSNFQGRERAVAFGIWAAFASVAAAVGPLVGGFLTTVYSWRWGFRINIFIVILLVCGSFFIKNSKDTETKSKLDIGGVLFSASGLFLVMFGIIEASTYGWLRAQQVFSLFGIAFNYISVCPVAIIIGIMLLGIFVWWENRMTKSGKTPLVSISIFRNMQFATGIILIFLLYVGFIGVAFLIPTFLQAVPRVSALVAGATFLAFPAGVFIFSQISTYLSKAIKPKYLIQFGLVIAAVGILILRNSIHVESAPSDLILGAGIFGIGMGFAFAHFVNVVMSAVSVNQAGEASGIYNTVTQMGIAFAVAIIGAIFVTTISTGLYAGIAQSTIIKSADKQNIASIIPSQVSNIEFGNVGALQTLVPAYTLGEINTISKGAVTDATRYALLYGFAFIFAALLFSFTLTGSKDLEQRT